MKYVSLLGVMHVHEHETWHAWSYKRTSGFTLYKGLTWGANPANLPLHPTKLRRTKNNQNRGSSQAGLDIDGLVRSDCRRKGSSPSGKSQYEKPSRTAPVGGWFTPVVTRSHPSISFPCFILPTVDALRTARSDFGCGGPAHLLASLSGDRG